MPCLAELGWQASNPDSYLTSLLIMSMYDIREAVNAGQRALEELMGTPGLGGQEWVYVLSLSYNAHSVLGRMWVISFTARGA